MLSVERCRDILNEAAPEGVTYTDEEAEQLRGVLYLIAGLHLNTKPTGTEDDAPERLTLLQSEYRRAG